MPCRLQSSCLRFSHHDRSSWPSIRRKVVRQAVSAPLSTVSQLGRSRLARISHELPVEARDRPAITSLRLLAALNAGFKYGRIVQETGH